MLKNRLNVRTLVRIILQNINEIFQRNKIFSNNRNIDCLN